MSKVPLGLIFLFNDPPLIGDEKRENYENLLAAFVAAIKHNDAVVRSLAQSFTDLT